MVKSPIAQTVGPALAIFILVQIKIWKDSLLGMGTDKSLGFRLLITYHFNTLSILLSILT